MSTAAALAVALTFVWLGMVLAISFLEAPLKFRAPGVTVPIGLGIGRLVFRALNACELVLAALVVLSMIIDRPMMPAVVALMIAVAALAAQLLLVRPQLAQRSDAVLAGDPLTRDAAFTGDPALTADAALTGDEVPRSRAHVVYVALEMIKVAGLLVGGILVLA